jgi:thioredoxin reductase
MQTATHVPDGSAQTLCVALVCRWHSSGETLAQHNSALSWALGFVSPPCTQVASLASMEGVDVVIVGGGPAGMSAALVLGRCGRRVVVFDHGRYRNWASRGLHGFLTRDGVTPAEFRRISREQLLPYPSVRLRELEVVEVRRSRDRFEVDVRDGESVEARALLLATGLTDRIPEVPGMEEVLGRFAFHCPYCDGWEQRGRALFAYGFGDEGARFALELTLWSPNIALCVDGGELPGQTLRSRLKSAGIPLHVERITGVTHSAEQIHLQFGDGTTRSRQALFYSVGCQQAST